MKELISVIGLGYVGLPLAIAVTQASHKVNGIDSDLSLLNLIKKGISPILEISNSEIQRLISSELFDLSSNFEDVGNSNIVVICVPTPLGIDRQPNLSYIESAVTSVSRNLRENTLILIESTLAPGTMRHFVLPLIERHSKLTQSEFDLAFSPERIDPSNKIFNLRNTPKIVGGYTEKSKIRAIQFYSGFIDSVIGCESMEVAETAKLLENSFRFVNISFINELTLLCQKLEIDINQVIQAAATKPFGFMPFYPSIGIGGHCIPVDPIYLSNKAHEVGVPSRFIDLADQVNQEMPHYFVKRAEEKLGGLRNKKVFVLGVAYKPNVADVRETPVSSLISGLKGKGALVSWHDDLIKEWNDEKSVDLKPGFDLAIIATPHAYMDFTKLGDTPILDTRGSI